MATPMYISTHCILTLAVLQAEKQSLFKIHKAAH